MVKIRELAEKLIVLAGKTPGTEVPIIYTGLRPGEKLYEELFMRWIRFSWTRYWEIISDPGGPEYGKG